MKIKSEIKRKIKTMLKRLACLALAIIFLSTSVVSPAYARSGNYGSSGSGTMTILGALQGVMVSGTWTGTIANAAGTVASMYMYNNYYNSYGKEVFSFNLGGTKVTITRGALAACIASTVACSVAGIASNGVKEGTTAVSKSIASSVVSSTTSSVVKSIVTAIVQVISDLIKNIAKMIAKKALTEVLKDQGMDPGIAQVIADTVVNFASSYIGYQIESMFDRNDENIFRDENGRLVYVDKEDSEKAKAMLDINNAQNEYAKAQAEYNQAVEGDNKDAIERSKAVLDARKSDLDAKVKAYNDVIVGNYAYQMGAINQRITNLEAKSEQLEQDAQNGDIHWADLSRTSRDLDDAYKAKADLERAQQKEMGYRGTAALSFIDSLTAGGAFNWSSLFGGLAKAGYLLASGYHDPSTHSADNRNASLSNAQKMAIAEGIGNAVSGVSGEYFNSGSISSGNTMRTLVGSAAGAATSILWAQFLHNNNLKSNSATELPRFLASAMLADWIGGDEVSFRDSMQAFAEQASLLNQENMEEYLHSFALGTDSIRSLDSINAGALKSVADSNFYNLPHMYQQRRENAARAEQAKMEQAAPAKSGTDDRNAEQIVDDLKRDMDKDLPQVDTAPKIEEEGAVEIPPENLLDQSIEQNIDKINQATGVTTNPPSLDESIDRNSQDLDRAMGFEPAKDKPATTVPVAKDQPVESKQPVAEQQSADSPVDRNAPVVIADSDSPKGSSKSWDDLVPPEIKVREAWSKVDGNYGPFRVMEKRTYTEYIASEDLEYGPVSEEYYNNNIFNKPVAKRSSTSNSAPNVSMLPANPVVAPTRTNTTVTTTPKTVTPTTTTATTSAPPNNASQGEDSGRAVTTSNTTTTADSGAQQTERTTVTNNDSVSSESLRPVATKASDETKPAVEPPKKRNIFEGKEPIKPQASDGPIDYAQAITQPELFDRVERFTQDIETGRATKKTTKAKAVITDNLAWTGIKETRLNTSLDKRPLTVGPYEMSPLEAEQLIENNPQLLKDHPELKGKRPYTLVTDPKTAPILLQAKLEESARMWQAKLRAANGGRDVNMSKDQLLTIIASTGYPFSPLTVEKALTEYIVAKTGGATSVYGKHYVIAPEGRYEVILPNGESRIIKDPGNATLAQVLSKELGVPVDKLPRALRIRDASGVSGRLKGASNSLGLTYDFDTVGLLRNENRGLDYVTEGSDLRTRAGEPKRAETIRSQGGLGAFVPTSKEVVENDPQSKLKPFNRGASLAYQLEQTGSDLSAPIADPNRPVVSGKPEPRGSYFGASRVTSDGVEYLHGGKDYPGRVGDFVTLMGTPAVNTGKAEVLDVGPLTRTVIGPSMPTGRISTNEVSYGSEAVLLRYDDNAYGTFGHIDADVKPGQVIPLKGTNGVPTVIGKLTLDSDQAGNVVRSGKGAMADVQQIHSTREIRNLSDLRDALSSGQAWYVDPTGNTTNTISVTTPVKPFPKPTPAKVETKPYIPVSGSAAHGRGQNNKTESSSSKGSSGSAILTQ